jgi:hypothetical protein
VSRPTINSSGSFSPAVVNVFEKTMSVLSLKIVTLYVSGVDLSNGIVNGLKSSSVLKSFVRLIVGPTPEDISKLFPLSIALLTDTFATLQGCITQWYGKFPSLLKEYRKKEFAVAGIIPELKIAPESGADAKPLVTV